jgi:hypothetical protein
MLIIVSAVLFGFGVLLFGLSLAAVLLGWAICAALKLLEWTLRFGLWLLNRFTELQPGDIAIVINIVDDDDDEDPPMRDVTPKRKWLASGR